MKLMKSLVASALAAALSFSVVAETKIAYSPYISWSIQNYVQESGILDKHNAKNGTDVSFVYVGSYSDSLTLYASKEFQGLAVTNMDVMTVPAVAGRHSTAIVAQDYSNGNDSILLKGYDSLASAADDGANINLSEYTVSHYLLARCAELKGVDINDFELVDTVDVNIPAALMSEEHGVAVTWNPIIQTIKETNVSEVCTSSDIAGEIIDMIVVGDEVSDAARKTIADAWFEGVSLVMQKDATVIDSMAAHLITTVDSVNVQLSTTGLFKDKAASSKFLSAEKLKNDMQKVITFSFNAGVYDGVDAVDEIGVKYPDGTVWGDSNNIGLTFDTSFLK